MKVSVIVAFYNVGPYVDECVGSIVRQTYKDLEIILIDDGSTDNSGSILDEWASRDLRIKVIHEDNEGLSFARNRGLDISTGEAIAFIDGDDAVKENYIEILVNTMNETDADMCEVGRYENVLDEETLRFFSPVDDLLLYKDSGDYIYDTYTDREKRFFQSAIVVWGKLYKRKVWDGVRFPKGRINEDSWVFPQVISRCDKIAVRGDCLYFYRKRRGSIMSVLDEHLICSKIDSWMYQVRWWRNSEDPQADKLLAMCEKYICHFIYTKIGEVNSKYRDDLRPEYKKMVRHMLFSGYIPIKTKVKYLTYASTLRVFG